MWMSKCALHVYENEGENLFLNDSSKSYKMHYLLVILLHLIYIIFHSDCMQRDLNIELKVIMWYLMFKLASEMAIRKANHL